MDIADNLALVRSRISAAAEKAGRRSEDILLVGATKMNDASRVREAIAAGLTVCGENRVQELLEKDALGAYEGAALHFIGHLQKNKVRYLVGRCSLIHSIDSMELLRAVDRCAVSRGVVQDVLIEVNIAGEESKSGLAPSELSDFLSAAGDFPGIRVRGLMAIPPICRVGEENLPYFRAMEQLFVDNGGKKYDNVFMDFLSMGMSGDFEAAIACGANIVRVGTALFGERDYTSAHHQQTAMEDSHGHLR